MSKVNNRQEEYNKLLATLRELSILELLDLFIEAKTGSQEDINNLPESYIITVDKLGELLNSFYADKIIDSLFKED